MIAGSVEAGRGHVSDGTIPGLLGGVGISVEMTGADVVHGVVHYCVTNRILLRCMVLFCFVSCSGNYVVLCLVSSREGTEVGEEMPPIRVGFVIVILKLFVNE